MKMVWDCQWLKQTLVADVTLTADIAQMEYVEAIANHVVALEGVLPDTNTKKVTIIPHRNM